MSELGDKKGAKAPTAPTGGDPLSQIAASVTQKAAPDVQRDAFEGPDWVTDRPPPPVHKWHPSHCGDIGMEIRSDGSWWHAGAPIRREELVRLFASILRLEPNGDHVLVTPVEKVLVHVALHPLRVVDAVTIFDDSSVLPTILAVRPDVIAKGGQFKEMYAELYGK
ncbi:MAG: DUF1285 domain-containing protein, partial [Luminiphilus sp.]